MQALTEASSLTRPRKAQFCRTDLDNTVARFEFAPKTHRNRSDPPKNSACTRHSVPQIHLSFVFLTPLALAPFGGLSHIVRVILRIWGWGWGSREINKVSRQDRLSAPDVHCLNFQSGTSRAEREGEGCFPPPPTATGTLIVRKAQ